LENSRVQTVIASLITERIASNRSWIDAIAIVALLLHPVLYRLDSSAGYFPLIAMAHDGRSFLLEFKWE
jgi:hypothetical protein